MRTWSCHCFFAPGAKAPELHGRFKQPHIDLTETEGGCWVHGGRYWLEQVLKDMGKK
jgi:hypothetical protein